MGSFCSAIELHPPRSRRIGEPQGNAKRAIHVKAGLRLPRTRPPGAEVLDKYVDPSFRPRLPELAPYKAKIRSREAGGGERHIHRFDQKIYERTLGEAEPQPGSSDGRVWRGDRKSHV